MLGLRKKAAKKTPFRPRGRRGSRRRRAEAAALLLRLVREKRGASRWFVFFAEAAASPPLQRHVDTFFVGNASVGGVQSSFSAACLQSAPSAGKSPRTAAPPALLSPLWHGSSLRSPPRRAECRPQLLIPLIHFECSEDLLAEYEQQQRLSAQERETKLRRLQEAAAAERTPEPEERSSQKGERPSS